MRTTVLAALAVLLAHPAAAVVCIDQGTITSLQVSAGPGLQIRLDGRATYALNAPGADTLAALATGAYLARLPVRVGFERTPAGNVLTSIEAPTELTVPPIKGCPALGLSPARP